MSSLTPEVKTELVEAIKKSYYNYSAICAYGSRIAGYARKDSDFDVIVVLKDYWPRIGYDYIDEEAKIAVLLVDEKTLRKDAEKGSLAEFAIGRLLNPFEPLEGEDFLRTVEKQYKKRVIKEGLEMLLSKYGDLAYELFIPPQYFLFQKLNSRYSLYPAVLYSFCRTYSEDRKRDNFSKALKAFQEGLEELLMSGIINSTDGYVRISSNYRISNIGKTWRKIKGLLVNLISYPVHVYSGRKEIKNLPKEITSKITRRKEIEEVPQELREPETLLKIEEGVLVTGEEWLFQVANYLGFSDGFRLEVKNLGDPFSVSKLYIVQSQKREKKMVVKQYESAKASIKWFPAVLFALPAKRYELLPRERLYLEYVSLKELKRLGFNVPQIYFIHPDKSLLGTEFLEGGEDLSTTLKKLKSGDDKGLDYVVFYGKTLAKVHYHDYSLGDTKPANCLIAEGKLYFIDLEQAGKGGDKAWDIAEFLYYSGLGWDVFEEKFIRKIAGSFLSGYIGVGDKRNVEKALEARYYSPFSSLLSPVIGEAIREEMERHLD